MINVKDKGYLESKSSKVHLKVYDELQGSKNLTENEVAKILNELRSIRNNADYDDDDEYSEAFFKDFLKEHEKDLKMAFEALEYLKNHSNY